MAEQAQELVVPDVDAWREWLAEHVREQPGVWLTLAKKGTTSPTSLTYAQALQEALCQGWIDGQAMSVDEHVYRQRFTPRRARSLWSERNVGYVADLRVVTAVRPETRGTGTRPARTRIDNGPRKPDAAGLWGDHCVPGVRPRTVRHGDGPSTAGVCCAASRRALPVRCTHHQETSMSTQYPPATQPGPAGDPAPYGGPAPTPQGTDTVSILGLVFAFLFWPVGLILSIIGLTRTGKGKRAGRGLAIAGVIVSLLAAVIAIVVIAIIATAANEAVTELDAAAEQFEADMAEIEASAGAVDPDAPVEEAAEEEPAEDVAVAVGEPATVDDVTFTVNSEQCGETTVGDEFLSTDAQGVFCLFEVTVLNGSTEPFLFDSSNVTAYIGEAEYSADGEASIYLPDNEVFLEEINPGNTVTATVVFDVPAGAQLDRLELSAGFMSLERAVVTLR